MNFFLYVVPSGEIQICEQWQNWHEYAVRIEQKINTIQVVYLTKEIERGISDVETHNARKGLIEESRRGMPG